MFPRASGACGRGPVTGTDFMRHLAWAAACLVALSLAISGCSSGSRSSDPFAGKGSPYYAKKGPLPKGGGRYVVGEPYQVAGRWFHPKEQPGYDKTGVASWYGPQFHRRMTSNGEWFDMEDLTAAHATLPLPSYVKVTNLENGREIVVRVNDRGPFVGTRIIDMSKRAAEKLDFKRKGMAKVRVQYIGPAPLNDKGSAPHRHEPRTRARHASIANARRGWWQAGEGTGDRRRQSRKSRPRKSMRRRSC